MGVEVYGKTLGIIGLGKIGKRLAKRGRGFDMTILAYDTYQDTEFAAQQGITYLPLDELLKISDFG
jgi:D-3-phosphoglycerate dehydrogenase